MARTRHGGRPMHTPASEPGRFIARRLQELGLAQGDFAARLCVSRTTIWRMLHGKTAYTTRPALGALCDALELTSAQRTALMRLSGASDQSPAATTGAAPHPSATASSGLGSPEPDQMASAQQLRAFLKRQLKLAHMTSTSFAAQLGVTTSTVTRLLNGDAASTHRIRPQRVAAVLHLEGYDRRTFLWIAFQAGLFAVTPQAPRPRGPMAQLERRLGLALDQVAPAVAALAVRRDRGEVADVYRQTRQLFVRLFDDVTPTLRRSAEVAQARLRVGFAYCEALAAALPWYQREAQMIAVLDRMQQEVVQYFPPTIFASEYGHIVNLRAPLYRTVDRGRPPRGEYQACIAELTDGLEHSISPRAEPTLHIELLRNRAHTYLYDRDSSRWRQDLEVAERLANGLRGEEGDQFRALVTYSWGEGYTHLVRQPDLVAALRRRYVQEALALLATAEPIFRRYPPWQGYALLAGIARAECLVSSAPDEAARQLRVLHREAEQHYPALTAKIARVAKHVGPM